MPSTWAAMVSTASKLTSAASTVTSLGFGAAKASTKLGFSIARAIASVTPIPLLHTSLSHLENLSLLPILLGESITSTSLTAASFSLSHISNLLQGDDEASFSLATFVALVRSEWSEHGATGRSVPEVARAVAAWAAIQGFTREWSEEQWLKSVKELKHDDFKPPPRPATPRTRRRAVSRVSVTDDVIMPGRFGQVVSADIGEKDPTAGMEPSTALSYSSASPSFSSAPSRSNYETRNNLRRLSKMVLAGYGGAGLLFFGSPLRPDSKPERRGSAPSPSDGDPRRQPARTDTEVKGIEEDVLVQVVEDAETGSMSPPMQNMPEELPSERSTSPRPRISTVRPPNHPASSSTYSWWNVLLGKHDREIFEGFAFTPAEDSDKDSLHSPLSPHPETPPPAPGRSSNQFLPRDTAALNVPSSQSQEETHWKEPHQPTATIIDMRSMPRFWVLTDHGRRQVVLVVRGTMSINELAADLNCEPDNFEPATANSPMFSKPVEDTTHEGPHEGPMWKASPSRTASSSLREDPPEFSDPEANMPGSFRVKPPTTHHHRNASQIQAPQPDQSVSENEDNRPLPRAVGGDSEGEDCTPQYQVHGGMLRLARAMGSEGKPVHKAVSAAMSRNRGYELVLCGHSLGAGIASLLALMWADPLTCRTIPSSGLPPNCPVSVYCFAPPCITSPALSRLCQNLITSIVYSFDFVSRLSLGSIRDLNRAAFWICEGEGEESTTSMLCRALKGKFGFGVGPASDTEDEKKWFIALRKTLEANMVFSHLFPPGKVWWALRDEALHPSHQNIGTGLRLYDVQQVEKVFQQIEFKGDMLSSHLPHQYDRVLAELEF